MFEKIKEWLSRIINDEYPVGALESPVDVRNLSASKYQAPLELAEEMETELKFKFNQGVKPKCVGSSITGIASDIKGVELSDDDLYEQCKAQDGIPAIDGTYISVGAKIATNNGIATRQAYLTGDINKIKDSRSQNKMDGYVWVERNFEAICQALAHNKYLVCGFSISSKWWSGIITKILTVIGGHAVIIKGYKYSKGIIKGQNSWGTKWIGYIAGIFNPIVKGGDFEMLWEDYKDNIYDIVAFTKISPEVKEEVAKSDYRFTTTMKLGSSGYEVKKLQERLGLIADGSFGKATQKAVINFQIKNGLLADGVVGAGTRNILNKNAKSLIEAWAKAIHHHEGYYKGSRSYRNNNPANFKSGTLTNFMMGLGAIAIDPQGFCIFPNYEVGFKALCSFLTKACKNELSSYQSTMTLYEFYKKYAPSSDGNNTLAYAKTVAKALGVTIDTKIVELL